MAGAKEIRGKIGSIKNTQKITSAMEMVAASKMRKAQDRMSMSRPYSDKIRNVIGHVCKAELEYKHPYLQPREAVKRVGYIIVSTDRGLCGGLNVNLFRKISKQMSELKQQNVGVDLALIGNKSIAFFKKFGGSVVAQANNLGDAPEMKDVLGVVTAMVQEYNEGKIDQLFVVYNEFVNTMTQTPTVKQLIPLAEQNGQSDVRSQHWDYLYEPDAKELLDALMARYVESQVYQGVVENAACEQAARMVAMKSATDNAGNLIGELQLAYNKARQASITQELSEIVAGAAAV